MMAASLSPTDLITSAVISTLVSQVNTSLGAQPNSPVLTVTDSGSGISLALAMAGEPTVALDNLTAAGGLGGRLHIDDIPPDGLSASLFGDFSVALTSFDLTLAQGTFVSTDIAGSLTIPDFTGSGNDQTIDIEVAIRADGTLAVTLAAQQSDPSKMTPDGLVALNFSLADGVGALDLAVSTLEITETGGKWSLTLTGSLTLTTEDINWPEVDLRGLSIDSAGNVSLQGGWIDLPSHAAIDFYGFHVALQRLGFGTTGNDKWIGFDADVNLVEGVTFGGSVRGLQVNLTTGAVSFAGISVDFEIPGVLSFSGEIDHASVQSKADLAAAGLPSNFPIPAQVLAGGVDVIIEAAGDLEIDAQFIVAQVPNPVPANGQPAPPGTPTQTCFFLSLDLELPVGIPLFADVALYGMSGMFAANLRPDIGTATWWDWYKYPTAADGTPDTTNLPDLQGDNGAPDYSATDVFKWLNPVSGAFALGAGAVIGTMDDGFTASASIAFMIILPGPVIIFVGKANILSKRISGPADEANFEAMATYDGNAGTFDLVIDAQYSIPVVLDVQAEAEFYVDPVAGVWFLAIGKPPHEQRVKARVLDLFESDLYFVVSNTGLVTGFWIGYQNSWSFGPLSASINAYLTATAAIQWSPLQLAAEAELHGEVHLSAFGFSMGITADALLAATAPSPWWVYGSLSVELDLPWPLPKVGGTVSLSWGANGPPPPAPLALNTVGATLIDHGASDHYELLAHREGATVNAINTADTVVYDPPPPAKPGTPGILSAQPPGYWTENYNPATLPDDPSSVVPDLGPATLARAPLVPQDSHFALSFAHPVADQAGFNDPVTPPKEIVAVPPAVGVDDLPGPKPPAVQWSIRHTLLQVALYGYDTLTTPDSWQLVAAAPKSVNGWAVAAPLPLVGAWVAPDPAKQVPTPGTVLKVAPYTVLSGEYVTVAWGGPPATLGTTFTDQGLQYNCGPGVLPATLAAPWPGAPTGLCFQMPGVIIQIAGQAGEEDASAGEVTITFPSAVVLTGLTGVVIQGGGKNPDAAPQVSANGQALTPTSVQPAEGPIYTLAFDPAGPVVTQIQLAIGAAGPTYLLGLSYSTPEINLPILPQAPGLYALKVVTRIEAGQVDGNGNVSGYQAVTDGNPVIEFAYLQCGSGPGTATIGAPTESGGFTDPLPYRQPPFPDLAVPAPATPPPAPPVQARGTSAAAAPATAFPKGGRLNDLSTYTQWSWPDDGDAAAYYGYDLNVEFNETYVNALYATFLAQSAPWDYQNSELPPAVHVRCVDRNQRYTILDPIATHVPSVYPQSAIVSSVVDLPLPATIAPAPPAPSPGDLVGRLPAPIASALAIGTGVGDGSASARSIAAAQSVLTAQPGAGQTAAVSATAQPALRAAIDAAGLDLQPTAVGAALAVNPRLRAVIADQLKELTDAATARSLWFETLAPQTRYTADVVAGPLRVSSDRDRGAAALAGGNSLQAIYQASDATAALAALLAYLAEEAALTTLQRVQFTTSRYATFSDQVANALAQVAGATAVPVRRYAVPAGVNPQTWLSAAVEETARESAAQAYLAARRALAAVVGRFDPLFDVNQPAPLAQPATGNGEQALAAQRAVTEQAWQAFASATSATFDGLIAALGQQGLVSSAKVVPPPDTELSVLTVGGDLPVVALLIASPEPLPWRRMWQWTSLDPYGLAGGLTGLTVLWSADQTRALLVPLGNPVGRFTLSLRFLGNIGAETACITAAGASVSETATTAPFVIAPFRIRSEARQR
jgi:hypothetical protein